MKRSWLFREPAAQPVVLPNYRDRMPPYETGVPGLLMANTTQVYPEDRGTNYAVREAEEVVAALLAKRSGAPSPRRGGDRGDLGLTAAAQVVLAVALAGAACAAFASALTLAVGNTEGVDTAVFVFAFGVLLPAAVVVVARAARWRRRARRASSLAGAAAIGLVAVLAVARIVDELAGDERRSSGSCSRWCSPGSPASRSSRPGRRRPPVAAARSVLALPPGCR